MKLSNANNAGTLFAICIKFIITEFGDFYFMHTSSRSPLSPTLYGDQNGQKLHQKWRYSYTLI